MHDGGNTDDLSKPRFDDDTGIYRDCPQCHGRGIDGKGCPQCEPSNKADFEKHCAENPPITFHQDAEDEMAIACAIFSGMTERPIEDTGWLLEAYRRHKKSWEEPALGTLSYKALYEHMGKGFREYFATQIRAELEAMQEKAEEEKHAAELAKRPQRTYQCSLCQKTQQVAEPEPWERIPFPKCCGKVMKHITTTPN